jgi:hypothetical protein
MNRWRQGWPLRSGRRRLVTRSQPWRTPPPRGAESAHPGRISTMRNVKTPSGSGTCPGKPTVREAQLPGGRRTVNAPAASLSPSSCGTRCGGSTGAAPADSPMSYAR